MKTPESTYVSISCKNLSKIKEFYNTNFFLTPIKESEDYIFFKLGHMVLCFLIYSFFEKETGVKPLKNNNSFISLNFHSKEEVYKIFNSENIFPLILRSPAQTDFGTYKCYIKDIENNILELVFNPKFKFLS
ncbi:MAG: hypothetical protein KDK36_20825 [Leptospiraceae bacterium]|nr:hypothetical protein [Leptospiraceae bacterium]